MNPRFRAGHAARAVAVGPVLVVALLGALPGQAWADEPPTTPSVQVTPILTSPYPPPPATVEVTPGLRPGQVLPVPVGAPETGGGSAAVGVPLIVGGAVLIGGVAALAGAGLANARGRRRGDRG